MNSHSIPQKSHETIYTRAITGRLTSDEARQLTELAELLYWAGATRQMRRYCYCIYRRCGYDAAKALAERWPSTAIANARLIAAAPDLLEACQTAYAAHNPCWRHEKWGDCDVCIKLNAAIKKATGEE